MSRNGLFKAPKPYPWCTLTVAVSVVGSMKNQVLGIGCDRKCFSYEELMYQISNGVVKGNVMSLALDGETNVSPGMALGVQKHKGMKKNGNFGMNCYLGQALKIVGDSGVYEMQIRWLWSRDDIEQRLQEFDDDTRLMLENVVRVMKAHQVFATNEITVESMDSVEVLRSVERTEFFNNFDHEVVVRYLSYKMS